MSDTSLIQHSLIQHSSTEPRRPDLNVLDVLRPLTTSTEPAEVFASAVRLCVPRLCDSAAVDFSDPEEPCSYRLCWPSTAADSADGPSPQPIGAFELPLPREDHIGRDAVYTPIRSAPEDGSAVLGVLALRFNDRRPGPDEALIGQLVAERISSTLHREQLRARLTKETSRADNLQQALVHSRDIGAALGILMALNKCTSDQAFALLRRASQHSHRKLYEIALDVIETGTLE